ncbi:unnamed protein product [Soboliphyme baturini]|uniref:Uncharacterized protein n=1 Tax=Soboliphyme baturini TaxID=241478 RepID=A0A183IGX2_9BILA|nr:unnamed protein product [Soboliphyme baturini]
MKLFTNFAAAYSVNLSPGWSGCKILILTNVKITLLSRLNVVPAGLAQRIDQRSMMAFDVHLNVSDCGRPMDSGIRIFLIASTRQELIAIGR